MPVTPNLGAPHLTETGMNKATVVNQVHDLFDAAIAGTLIKNVAGSSNVTLTTSPDGGEANNAILVFTGLLTGNIAIILPAITKKWRIVNNTTGAFTLTPKAASGTGVAFNTGDEADVRYDGANFIRTPAIFPYCIGFESVGGGVAHAAMIRHEITLAMTWRSGLPNSKGRGSAVATAQTDYDIRKNAYTGYTDGTSVGTMRFALGAATATFIFSGDQAMVIGDEFSIWTPASPDATLVDVRATIRGDR